MVELRENNGDGQLKKFCFLNNQVQFLVLSSFGLNGNLLATFSEWTFGGCCCCVVAGGCVVLGHCIVVVNK